MHWPSCRSDAWMKESSLGWRQVHLKVMYVLLSTIMIDYACMFFTCLCQDLPVFLRCFPCRLWHEFAMWRHHRSLEMLYHWVDHALGKLTSMQISVSTCICIFSTWLMGVTPVLFVGSGVSNHRAIGTWSIASNFKVWRGRLVDIWGRAKGWTWSDVGRGAISVQ